eukprot:TRINITY_DN363_c2_g1_i1.p1 TRINITY_DN363_c2_g1~~TRINITY_DN363_c2_g1_i1.p1  ORF type:complete len:229 (-),score=70.39 TRINITY_DN363_c2_g1_i1:79-765(-)
MQLNNNTTEIHINESNVHNYNYNNLNENQNQNQNENENELENKPGKCYYISLIILIAGLLSYVISGCVVLGKNSEIISESGCRGAQIFAVTISSVIAFLLQTLSHRFPIVLIVSTIITFAISIWSTIEYALVSESCETLLSENYSDLFSFFEASAILSMIYISAIASTLICLIILFFVCFTIFIKKLRETKIEILEKIADKAEQLKETKNETQQNIQDRENLLSQNNQ